MPQSEIPQDASPGDLDMLNILDNEASRFDAWPPQTDKIDVLDLSSDPSDFYDVDTTLTDFGDVATCATPARVGPNTCILCYFDTSVGDGRKEASVFARPDSMKRHAQRAHFQDVRRETYWTCPDGACAEIVFDGPDYFKTHVANGHNSRF